MDPAEIIDRLNRLGPDLVRLARSASLAARIEPALLRWLRLDLLPGSDAGLEADLYFSPLTHSSNASSIVLRADVVEFLREQLAAPVNRPLLDRARQIVEEAHQSAPSVIQLEEKVTWLALRGDDDSELEAELKRAVYAMTQEDRPGIAQWAARALPRLPARARHTEAAWLLAMGAAARLGGREILDEDAAAEVSPELVRAVLPKERITTHIGVRLLEDGVEFGGIGLPGAKFISVPRASPVTLDLKWHFQELATEKTASMPPRAPILQSATLLNDPILIEVASGRRALSFGNQPEPAIKTLQNALNQLMERDPSMRRINPAPSVSDGIFGQSTTKAVRNFQRLHNLTADGLVGPQTIIALDRALQDAPAHVVFSLGSQNKFKAPGDNADRALAEVQITTALGEEHHLRRVQISATNSEAAKVVLRRLRQPGPKRILAIDAGGLRVTIALQFLVRIEVLLRERYSRPDLRLADYFDLIGGSSAGGLIASALALGLSTAELLAQWEQFSPNIFTKANFLRQWQSKFDDSHLNRGLAKFFGDQAMMAPAMRTGLCLLLKRADTGAPYTLLNHPESPDFQHQSTILLRDAVRASMAAPTYFAPISLELGSGENGVFMDAGASMMADPALHLLLTTTLRSQPFRWATGEENLLLVSIGSGFVNAPPGFAQSQSYNLLFWASQLPSLLLQSGRLQAQRLLREVARSLTTASPTEETGLTTETAPRARARLSYARFDVPLDPSSLSQLGLSELSSRADGLLAFDDPDRLGDYLAVGEAAARQVDSLQFPSGFDPDFQTAESPKGSRPSTKAKTTPRKSAATKKVVKRK